MTSAGDDTDSSGSSSSHGRSGKNTTSNQALQLDASEETPVLSHAEQRRQKKKLVQSQDVDRAKTLKSTNPLGHPKRQNSVWVGNLSFKTGHDALRQFFDGCGEVTRVHMPTKLASTRPGEKGAAENRGFAFVDFATADQKAVAISLSENHLDGRRLLIKDGSDFAGRPSASKDDLGNDAKLTSTTATKTAQKILRAQKQPAGPTLFFGNLGFETTEQSLRDLLVGNHARTTTVNTQDKSQAQESWIRKIRMGTFEDSGKCKGWAFVDFHRKEDATDALINVRNHRLDGRQLVVEYASPEAVRRGGGKAGQGNIRQEKGTTDLQPRPTKRQREDHDGEGTGDLAEDQPPAKRRVTKSGQKGDTRIVFKGSKARPKPGAALALAKRETAAIVPSQGQRIVF